MDIEMLKKRFPYLLDDLKAICEQEAICGKDTPEELERLDQKNNPNAGYCLALIYLLGHGVDVNLGRALMWINVASLKNKDDPEIQDTLKLISGMVNENELIESKTLLRQYTGIPPTS